MFPSRIPPRRRTPRRARRLPATGRRMPQFRPRLEAFEDRVLLSTLTWDGGSANSSNWSDRFNWQGDVAPVGGEDLVFPSGAARQTNSNNFPSGTPFHSITFSGFGYTISGGSFNVLNLGPGGIINNS